MHDPPRSGQTFASARRSRGLQEFFEMVKSRRNRRVTSRLVRVLAVLSLILIGSNAGPNPASAQETSCATAEPGNVDQTTAAAITVPGCTNVPNDPNAQAVFAFTIPESDVGTFWT